MACNEVHCCSIVNSVVYKCCVKMFLDGEVFGPNRHFSMTMWIGGPIGGVYLVDFVIDLAFDVGLRYWAGFFNITCSTKLCHFIRLFVTPQSRMGCYPSDFHRVVGSNAVDRSEAILSSFTPN